MATYDIPQHFFDLFTSNVELLLQEKAPVFQQAVTDHGYSGQSAQVVKQFGSVEFQENTTRHGDTNFSNLDHKQRWMFPSDYDLALPIDKQDQIRTLGDITSPYVEAMRAAYARKYNSIVYTAMLGSAKTGKNGGTTTAFDTANQQVAVDYVTPGDTVVNNGLTVAKLRWARKILKKAFALEDGEQAFIAVGAEETECLLRDPNITNIQYNTVRALVDGEVNSFMGFTFLPYESLSVASNIASVPVWVKSGVHYGMWNGLETTIDRRPDKKNLKQVMMQFSAGATRTQEAKVVNILCDRTK